MRDLVSSVGMAAAFMLAAPGADAAPFQFDCQSRLGEHPNLWSGQTGPNYRVRGTLEWIELARWPYPPGPIMMDGNTIPPTGRNASVGIESDVDGNYVTLFITADPGVEDRVEVSVGLAHDTDETGQVHDGRDVMTVPLGDLGRVSLPFELTADATGVTVEVAGHRMRFDVLIGARGLIRVGCEGGDFMFRDLDWAQ